MNKSAIFSMIELKGVIPMLITGESVLITLLTCKKYNGISERKFSR